MRSSAESAALFSKLEFVSLPVRTVLNESGQAIHHAVFLNDGLVLILSLMTDGDAPNKEMALRSSLTY